MINTCALLSFTCTGHTVVVPLVLHVMLFTPYPWERGQWRQQRHSEHRITIIKHRFSYFLLVSNKKSSAVKRILSEARELKEPTSEFHAAPLEDNIFEWHFTLRGPSGTEFEHGSYHGRIVLPAEYPFRPPDVMILTPNGRWELNKKVGRHTILTPVGSLAPYYLQICLTFTGFHEEVSLREAFMFHTHMNTDVAAGVGYSNCFDRCSGVHGCSCRSSSRDWESRLPSRRA